MGVEAKADGFEVLGDGDMHPFVSVAGSGEPVSGASRYLGVRCKARVAWVIFRALRGGEFIMAKLATNVHTPARIETQGP
jgi:hypothetical protein